MSLTSIQRVPTLFLKTVIILIAVAVFTFCLFFIPYLATASIRDVPEFRYVFPPALAGVTLSAPPFFFALFQAFILLRLIDRSDAFSRSAAAALRKITFSAIAMSVCYALCLPMAFLFAELDDAPGLIIYATAFACAPLVVATFAAVLEKLVHSAADMKSEQDLTV